MKQKRFALPGGIVVAALLGCLASTGGAGVLFNETFSDGTYKTPPADWYTSATGNTDAGGTALVLNFGTQYVLLIAKFTNSVVTINRNTGLRLTFDYNPQSSDGTNKWIKVGLVNSTSGFPSGDDFNIWEAGISGLWTGYQVAYDAALGGSLIAVQNDSANIWLFDNAADDQLVSSSAPSAAVKTYSGLTRSAQMDVYVGAGSLVNVDYFDSTLDDPNLGTASTLIASGVHSNDLGTAITTFDSVAISKSGVDSDSNKGRAFYDNIVVETYYIPPTGTIVSVK
jgi:hypothetical protein